MAQLRSILLLALAGVAATYATYKPLEDPILKIIDGKKGIFDAKKVENTLWLIREIKYLHDGEIKLSKEGANDPRAGTPTKIIFKGKGQTLASLIVHQENAQKLTVEEQKELAQIFRQVKDYFGHVNEMMIADARGAQEFMIKIIKEYCRKYNRPQSLLLNWNKNVSEAEMYERDITSFKILNVFTTDLMNFLAVLIKSCPKAFESFKATTHKKG